MAVRGVEDREAAHADRRVTLRFQAGIIGSAMEHGVAHAGDEVCPDDGRYGRINDSGDAAHGEGRAFLLRTASPRHFQKE